MGARAREGVNGESLFNEYIIYIISVLKDEERETWRLIAQQCECT